MKSLVLDRSACWRQPWKPWQLIDGLHSPRLQLRLQLRLRLRLQSTRYISSQILTKVRGRAFNVTLIFTPAQRRAPSTLPFSHTALFSTPHFPLGVLRIGGLPEGVALPRADLITHVCLFKLGLRRRVGNVSFMLIKYCLCQLGQAGNRRERREGEGANCINLTGKRKREINAGILLGGNRRLNRVILVGRFSSPNMQLR